MSQNIAIHSSQYLTTQELVVMSDYEEQFVDMPDMVGTRDAMVILNVVSIQGVHHIMGHLPENAPAVKTEDYVIGKRKLILYSKTDLIALRRYRDENKT